MQDVVGGVHGRSKKAGKGGVMKILWIPGLLFLLSVVAYSGVSSAPPKRALEEAVVPAASSVRARQPAQSVAAARPAYDGNHAATDFSAYVLLHKTRYETTRGEARANMCPE